MNSLRILKFQSSVDNEEKNELEGLFTLEECRKVLETFEVNLQGEDGFTAEFYKHFFDLVGTDLKIV